MSSRSSVTGVVDCSTPSIITSRVPVALGVARVDEPDRRAHAPGARSAYGAAFVTTPTGNPNSRVYRSAMPCPTVVTDAALDTNLRQIHRMYGATNQRHRGSSLFCPGAYSCRSACTPSSRLEGQRERDRVDVVGEDRVELPHGEHAAA